MIAHAMECGCFRLKEYNLNTYMYAPKDDALHRKLWRQLYDDVEKGMWK